MVFEPPAKFASMIAARNVHTPEGVLEQTPFDGSASGSSSELSTTYVLPTAGLTSPTNIKPATRAVAFRADHRLKPNDFLIIIPAAWTIGFKRCWNSL